MFLIYWPTLSDVTAESAATAVIRCDSLFPFTPVSRAANEVNERKLIISWEQEFLTCQLIIYKTGLFKESICFILGFL
jgi:hypothetical protein